MRICKPQDGTLCGGDAGPRGGSRARRTQGGVRHVSGEIGPRAMARPKAGRDIDGDRRTSNRCSRSRPRRSPRRWRRCGRGRGSPDAPRAHSRAAQAVPHPVRQHPARPGRPYRRSSAVRAHHVMPIDALSPGGASVARARRFGLHVVDLRADSHPRHGASGAGAFGVLGIVTVDDAFASFSNPMVYLFLGGFILAKALMLHGLDKRFAYWLLARKWVGSSPVRIMLAIGAATALCSGWVSNTATAAMMVPLSVGCSTSSGTCSRPTGATSTCTLTSTPPALCS